MPEIFDRPYKDKTIRELVYLFNDKCLVAKRLGHKGASAEFDENGEGDEALPSSFLKDPADEADIEAMDSYVRSDTYNFTEGLPADYLEFLRISDGIYAHDRAVSNDEIFRPVSMVEMENGAFDVQLLPHQIMNTNVDIDWPELDWGIQLGAGGDEGYHLIVSPLSIKEAVTALDEAYNSASEENKKTIEDAAEQIYGSLANLRKTKCVILRMYHWDAQTECFASFKHLLEDFVQGMDKMNAADHDDKDNGNDGASQVEAKPTTNKRKKVPDGKVGALKGLKLIFTGMFDTMDRDTCEAAVKKYGGEMTTKLEDSNYVVLGTNPGPKKIDTIKSKGLTTIDEEGFFQLLQGKKPHETKEGVRDGGADFLPSKKYGDARKEVPNGEKNVLEGLKIIFTGTMETMDRATAKKAAEKYGAKIITKLEDTDFVVLGKNAGPNKIAEIERNGLKTMSEKEFLDMLQDGKKAVDVTIDDTQYQATAASARKADDPAPQTGTRSSKRIRKE